MKKSKVEHVKKEVLLSEYSHINIGGECDNFYEPTRFHEICDIYCEFKGQKIIPIGGGSNILFGKTDSMIFISDNGLKKKIDVKRDKTVKVSSNFNINHLISELHKSDLGGFEFLSGIPAHLGGLIKMNAGAYEKEISEFIDYVRIVDLNGEKQTIHKEELEFSYRNLNIKGYIYEVGLSPKKISKEYSKYLVAKYASLRVKTQPLKKPNIGCFFKNPDGISAGKIIDECGLKGFKIGDAEVSDKHANFIINNGNAKFEDVSNIIGHIKKVVKKEMDVELELEIIEING